MQNIQAILFDLFGTLVDYMPQVEGKDFTKTHEVFQNAIQQEVNYSCFLNQISKSFSKLNQETFYSDIEFPMEQVFIEVLSMCGIKHLDQPLMDQIVSQYCQEWKCYVTWNSDLQNLLLDLKNNYKIGVITNTHNSKLVCDLLKEIGIYELFDIVMTSIEFGKRKPNQNIFLETCLKMKVAPENCIFVGDSLEMDVVGSKSVGMLPIQITTDKYPSHRTITNVLELRGIGLI